MTKWRADLVTGSLLMLNNHLQALSKDGWEFVSFCPFLDTNKPAWTVIAKKEQQ